MRSVIFDDPEFCESFIELRTNPIGHNELIEKPAIYSLLPDLKGRNILDLGCGHGDFCRHAALNSAKTVTGVDISKRMVEFAKTFNMLESINYVNQDMIEYEENECSFDLVFSSLAIHYVEPFNQLFEKIFKLLRNNGLFVFSVEHPIYTTMPNSWSYKENGERDFWKVDNYNSEGKRNSFWLNKEFDKYHRKIETYINTLIKCGFHIVSLLEPQPDSNTITINPNLDYETKRPPFLIISATCIKS